MLRFLHAADFHLDSPFRSLAPGQAAARRRAGRDTGRHPRTAGHSQLGDGGPAADAGALSHVPRERRQRAAHHPCRHALPLGGQRPRVLGCALLYGRFAETYRWESRAARAARLSLYATFAMRRPIRSFRPPFTKGGGVEGQSPSRGPLAAKLPFTQNAQEGGLGETLAGGFPQAAIRMQRAVPRSTVGSAEAWGWESRSAGASRLFVLRCVRCAPH